ATKKGKSLDADLVFATSTPLTIAIPAVFTARALKVPMVFEVRDLWPELPIAMGALNNKVAQKLAYQLEDWAYKNSKAIVA
ncbi:glycosyltransferase family 4 protein, partial [Acinetobacter baumannii]|nr:glycosyltransferase family 4 protein [Acinetobacter baumannii]